MTNHPPPAAPVVQHVYHHHVAAKSNGVAVLLELLPGMLLQTFGIGHLYAGRTGLGLCFMFGYWAVAFVNFLLCFVVIGLFTWPLCWIATAVVTTIIAANSPPQTTAVHVERH